MWDAMLVGARFLQFTGALVLLGSSLFCLYGLRPDESPLSTPARWQWPRFVMLGAAPVAIAGTVLWVMAETVLFSEDPADGTRPAAVWAVFADTQFGRVCLGRMALLTVSIGATLAIARLRPLSIVQSALGLAIIASFAWTGHGAMTRGWPGVVHLSGDLVHLWGAAVWVGALLPLAILIGCARRSAHPADAMAAHHGLARFSAIGTAVVGAIIVSGLINSWFLIGPGNWRTVFTSTYGVVLLVKLGLFLLMLVPAAANRYWLSPRLACALEQETVAISMPLRALTMSLLIEISLAFCVLVAVGVLGTLAPA